MNKIKLENGDEYCLIEKEFAEEALENNTNLKRNNKSNLRIKINNIRRPNGMAMIVLRQGKDYVGHISSNLYEDCTASLIMSGIRAIELPDELSEYRNLLERHDTALYVDQKYRRQGKATLLMKLMFQYLNEKGIKDLEVCGIVDDVAMQTYLSTGAEIIGEKTAIYRDIGRFFPKEKEEEIQK